jgi:hypothetical protein
MAEQQIQDYCSCAVTSDDQANYKTVSGHRVTCFVDQAVRALAEHHSDVSQTLVTLPRWFVESIYDEFDAAENIMKSAHRYFDAPGQADLRRHRKQCSILRGRLQVLLPTTDTEARTDG